MAATNYPEQSKGWRICQTCKCKYHSYEKRRKYCSRKCAGLSPENIKKLNELHLIPRKPKIKKVWLGYKCKCIICENEFKSLSQTKYCLLHKEEARHAQGTGRKITESIKIKANCLYCGTEFKYFPSSVRKYCSYKCHIDSGGAYRAGKAAKSMTRKYGVKKDANHNEIINAFKKLGAGVLDLSSVGNGVPDLLVYCRGIIYLVDIKNLLTGYGRRGLNPLQKEWAKDWKGGPVYLIYTVEDAADLVNGRLDKLKRFPEEDK